VSVTESRTRRSVRNVGVSVLGQGVVLVLGFVTRTVFIQQLGVELLGVQSLLISVLAIVSVADAGVSWALMYSLYRPLRDADEAHVAALVRHAATWYRWIAGATALIGLAILPFLDLLVDLEQPVDHLHLYYLVLLAGVVLQYPMYHRVLLLEADQRAYWTKLVTIAVNLARSVLQIAVLVLWQDFLLFLVIQAVATVVVNAIVYRHVGRHYPYLHRPGALAPEARKEVGASVRAMLVYRVSGLALANTQPILISALLGTLLLGYYANYLLVVGSVVMVLEMAFAALTPSIGNLVASGDRGGTRRVFDELQLLAVGLYGTAAVGFLLCLDPLIRLWLGPEFVLSRVAVVLCIANFYLVGAISPVTGFRGPTGMFREARYVLVVTAVLNLVLAVPLAHLWGLPGILLATLLARLLTNVWLEPFFLFRRYVTGGAWPYVRMHLLVLGVLTVAYVVLTLAGRLVGDGWPGLVATALGAGVLVPGLIMVTLGRQPAGQRLVARLRHVRSPAPRHP
jgi:O-antigen/teichoic acid export membrane protein